MRPSCHILRLACAAAIRIKRLAANCRRVSVGLSLGEEDAKYAFTPAAAVNLAIRHDLRGALPNHRVRCVGSALAAQRGLPFSDANPLWCSDPVESTRV